MELPLHPHSRRPPRTFPALTLTLTLTLALVAASSSPGRKTTPLPELPDLAIKAAFALLVTALCCALAFFVTIAYPKLLPDSSLSSSSSGRVSVASSRVCVRVPPVSLVEMPEVVHLPSSSSSSSSSSSCLHKQLNGGTLPPLTPMPPPPSMMEQIVPEITQHMLSYLDYRSLCTVSMANSVMRRAANDDTAWKALYQKDFNSEQNTIVASNGWKAHYAVTKAVIELNRSFYKNFQAKSIRGMSRLWLCADYVKCIHPGGELMFGYDAIMESWRDLFSWVQKFEFDLQNERARVFGNVAWVTLRVFINSAAEPLFTTNVFECHNGSWLIVHHHSSLQLEGGDLMLGLYGLFV